MNHNLNCPTFQRPETCFSIFLFSSFFIQNSYSNTSTHPPGVFLPTLSVAYAPSDRAWCWCAASATRLVVAWSPGPHALTVSTVVTLVPSALRISPKITQSRAIVKRKIRWFWSHCLESKVGVDHYFVKFVIWLSASWVLQEIATWKRKRKSHGEVCRLLKTANARS